MQAVNKMHTPRAADCDASRAAAIGSVGLCPAEKSLRLVCIGKLTRREPRCGPWERGGSVWGVGLALNLLNQ